MKEYDKIKAEQAEQLRSIDDIHPMKMVAVMSAIKVLMLVGMGLSMYLIGISV